MKTNFGPFIRGINNRAPEFALGTFKDGGDFLRDAMNVDITSGGVVKRRKGYSYAGPASTVSDAGPAGRMTDHLGYLATQLDGMMQGTHMSRRVAVMGNKLLFSYPFAQDITNGAFQYESFPAPITGWASTGDGLYVSADAIYFIPGGLPAANTRQVHPDPALRGSFGTSPYSNDVYWVCSHGVAIGAPDGSQVKLLHWDNYTTNLAGEATTVYYERDGLRQIIAVVDQAPSLAPGASSTFMDAAVF